jgi:hypothetical protein
VSRKKFLNRKKFLIQQGRLKQGGEGGVTLFKRLYRVHPPTQETMALAVEGRVNARHTISTINLSCFGGFRSSADDPPKSGRRWVWFWGTTGLPVGLHLVLVVGVLEDAGKPLSPFAQ